MDDKMNKRNAEEAQEQPGSMSSYNNRSGNREGSVEEATGDEESSEDKLASDSHSQKNAAKHPTESKS